MECDELRMPQEVVVDYIMRNTHCKTFYLIAKQIRKKGYHMSKRRVEEYYCGRHRMNRRTAEAFLKGFGITVTNPWLPPNPKKIWKKQ